MGFLARTVIIFSMYQIIAQINIEHGIFLVQDSEDLSIYVKKVLNIYNLDVYKFLFENHIEGTPLIKELIKEGDKLIIYKWCFFKRENR